MGYKNMNGSLEWWESAVNRYAADIPNAPLVSGVSVGYTTEIKPTKDNDLGGKLTVGSHHLRVGTATPAGRWLAAYVAHHAATAPANSGATRLLRTIFGSLTVLGAVYVVTSAITHALPGTILFWSVMTALSGLGFTFLVRTHVEHERNVFYDTIQKATNTAGNAAAAAFALGDCYQYRSVIHNLMAGMPLSPNGVSQAVLSTLVCDDNMAEQG